MFSKLPGVFVACIVLSLAAATPTTPLPPPITAPTSPQCCASVVPSTSAAASAVAALVGIDLTGLNVPVGLSCSPITVAGNNCGNTAVTCDEPEVEWGGLIAINCIPITA
ncbi:fungal hydrophobin [Mycena albidolilacea]|uniref:Hydrophobin n=1 Tax=Mycena albidolilacea TaxID=1033008 RepID=A0AAD7EW04_9AGAR|nr:fungal hydrophobin [Mycena albidolilacea]